MFPAAPVFVRALPILPQVIRAAPRWILCKRISTQPATPAIPSTMSAASNSIAESTGRGLYTGCGLHLQCHQTPVVGIDRLAPVCGRHRRRQDPPDHLVSGQRPVRSCQSAVAHQFDYSRQSRVKSGCDQGEDSRHRQGGLYCYRRNSHPGPGRYWTAVAPR